MPRQRLHIALAGLRSAPVGPWSGPLRAQFRWVRDAGVRGVRLDAADPAIRPRDLGRSGRRDLAASLRRDELAFGGLDILIPPAHYDDPERQNRAIDAVAAACSLAGELAALNPGSVGTVGVTLPTTPAPELIAALGAAGERWGVRLADFTRRETEPVRTDAAVGVGIDTAAVLAAGGDPAGEVAKAGGALAALRLADWAGGSRCPVGSSEGRLDTLAVVVAISMTSLDAVDLDLRGLSDPARGVRAGLDAWRAAEAFPA